MKTYYFAFDSGWIGGSGVVVSKTKNEALILAKKAILEQRLETRSGIYNELTLEDLIEVKKESVIITSHGDY